MDGSDVWKTLQECGFLLFQACIQPTQPTNIITHGSLTTTSIVLPVLWH